MIGKVYLKLNDKNRISIQTKDNRFFRITFREYHKFYKYFERIKIGDVVQWENTTYFKILEDQDAL